MRITTVEIRNFKAIKDETIEFGPYNIIIGKNDVGKSSLLEALELLLNLETPEKSDFHNYKTSRSMKIRCEFEAISSQLKRGLTDEYLNGDELAIEARYTSSGGRAPDELYINDQQLKGGAIEISGEKQDKRGSRDYIEQALTETVPVLANREPDSATSLTRGSWLTKLMSPVLSSETINDQKGEIKNELLDEFEDVKASLNAELSDQHPHINNIRIDIGEIDLRKAISPEVEVRDNNTKEWMALSERGAGVGNQFILSMMKSYADSSLDDDYVVLYEEPENSLHPGAVREMGSALRQIASQGNQVILTTHSPSLIDTHENGNLIVVRNEDGEAEFERLDEDGFEAIEEIGAKNSDLLQSNYVLYVEGASDAEVIDLICKREFDDWASRNVTIQPAGGGNLRHQLANMNRINRNSGLLLDSDRDSRDGELGSQTAGLVEEAEDVGIDYWVLERRELENYFAVAAMREVLSDDVPSVDAYEKAEEMLSDYGYNNKHNNSKVRYAREIADMMYDMGKDDEFEDLKRIVREAFDNGPTG
jgi:putative ATP-dependent endonuclease of OLD family